MLLPTLKVSLLAHANKGGRVFSSPPPRGRTGTQDHPPPIYPAAYVAASNMHQQLKSCPAVPGTKPGADGGQVWSQVKLSSKELEEHCACLHQKGLVVPQRGLMASAK